MIYTMTNSAVVVSGALVHSELHLLCAVAFTNTGKLHLLAWKQDHILRRS